MTARRWTLLSCGGITAAVLAAACLLKAQAAGGQSPRAGGAGVLDNVPRHVDPVRQLTRLQLDVFELSTPYQRLVDVDLDDLAADGAAPRGILDKLQQLGDARILVRYDNVVDFLAGTTVRSGVSLPVVTDVVVSSGGNFVPSIRFENVGFQANLSGVWQDDIDPTQAEVTLEFQVSDHLDQHLEINEQVRVPVVTERLRSQQTRAVRSGHPILLACNDLQLDTRADSTTHLTVVRLVATRLGD